MPPRRLGPFELSDRLGSGGMGEVFRATHVDTGKVVALKVVRADLVDNPRVAKRFAREVRILKKLRHPNIVRCYGGSVQGDNMYCAMQLVEGGSLSQLLKQRGRLPWERALKYGLQICDALECAHKHQVIHRDIKPSNLLISKRSGRLKLSDFGLARYTDATALTVAGRAVGTCSYTAPELIRGRPEVSHRSDLYSFGCVLFEMLTGRRPFEAQTHAEVFYQHLEETPPAVRSLAMDCPIWLEALVAQLLAKDPQNRPMDAGMVRHALIEVQERVASQSSVLEHSMSGMPSIIKTSTDRTEAVAAMGRRKKKSKKKVPLHERAWFLAACLGLLAVVVTWALWPLGEAELYRRGAEMMKSDEPIVWKDAQKQYLEPYVERFPDGEHITQVQQSLDLIEMRATERRFQARNKLGGVPRSEAERLYAQALAFEQFGDSVTALEAYESMIVVLESDEENADENRPYIHLAQRQAAGLRQAAGSTDRRELLDAVLAEADSLYRQGFVFEAREKWKSIVRLYSNNRELQFYVNQASARIDDPEQSLATPEAIPAEDPKPPASDEAASRSASAPMSDGDAVSER